MSKTNDTSKLNHAILENRDVVVVADGDLDAATRGASDCSFEYTERTPRLGQTRQPLFRLKFTYLHKAVAKGRHGPELATLQRRGRKRPRGCRAAGIESDFM